MKRISVVRGDITKLEVDAIVNAANMELRAGAGVDGAIHRAGGPAIQEACTKIGRCEVGDAVVTPAGNLKAKYVIHTVGPVWYDGNHNEENLLASAYRNSLKRAVENGVKTIAFPNISTGAYGFPKELAAKIALKKVNDFLTKNPNIQHVTFCCFDVDNFLLYHNMMGL